MKLLSVLLCLVLITPAYAIRRVGFGGGDAENTVLRMAEYIPTWSKACLENKDLCESLPSRFTKPTVKFDGEPTPAPYCKNDLVMIPNDILYVDDETPVAMPLLAQALIKGVIACQAPWAKLSQIPRLLPYGTRLPETDVVALQGESSDVFVGLSAAKNLHEEFRSLSGCQAYRVIGSLGNSTTVRCLDKSWIFLVVVVNQAEQARLRVRYYSIID